MERYAHIVIVTFFMMFDLSIFINVEHIERQLQFIDIELLIDMLDISKSISYFSKISFHFHVAIHNDQSL